MADIVHYQHFRVDSLHQVTGEEAGASTNLQHTAAGSRHTLFQESAHAVGNASLSHRLAVIAIDSAGEAPRYQLFVNHSIVNLSV
jgi:hypothetical protein